MTRTATTAVLAVLLGAALMGAPGAAQASSRGEKWWTPRQSRVDGSWRDSRPRGFTRQWRSWGGRRVYRDVIVIRASRGPQYRAWRTYCPPDYIYSRRLIRVRPIRFVVASAYFGGVGFHGSYCDDSDVYGCNFCDARFSSYDAYQAHVRSCSHRPHGYDVQCSDWNAPGGRDYDRGWQCDDRGSYGDDHGRWNQDDEDNGRWDRDDDDNGRWDRGDIDDDYDR